MSWTPAAAQNASAVLNLLPRTSAFAKPQETEEEEDDKQPVDEHDLVLEPRPKVVKETVTSSGDVPFVAIQEDTVEGAALAAANSQAGEGSDVTAAESRAAAAYGQADLTGAGNDDAAEDGQAAAADDGVELQAGGGDDGVLAIAVAGSAGEPRHVEEDSIAGQAEVGDGAVLEAAGQLEGQQQLPGGDGQQDGSDDGSSEEQSVAGQASDKTHSFLRIGDTLQTADATADLPVKVHRDWQPRR